MYVFMNFKMRTIESLPLKAHFNKAAASERTQNHTNDYFLNTINNVIVRPSGKLEKLFIGSVGISNNLQFYHIQPHIFPHLYCPAHFSAIY